MGSGELAYRTQASRWRGGSGRDSSRIRIATTLESAFHPNLPLSAGAHVLLRIAPAARGEASCGIRLLSQAWVGLKPDNAPSFDARLFAKSSYCEAILRCAWRTFGCAALIAAVFSSTALRRKYSASPFIRQPHPVGPAPRESFTISYPHAPESPFNALT